MKFSIVKNNKIINVIDATEAFMLANYDDFIVIEGSYPIGATFKDNQVYTPVTVQESQILDTSAASANDIRVISVWAFMNRLEKSQRIAIRHIMRDYNHPLCDDVTDLVEELFKSGQVHLDLTKTGQALDYLIAQGLVENHQKNTILQSGQVSGGVVV